MEAICYWQTRFRKIGIAAVLDGYPILQPGPRFNIKIPSSQYRKSHCGDKTLVRSSYLHNGISYTGKTTSLYWIRALHPMYILDFLLHCFGYFYLRPVVVACVRLCVCACLCVRQSPVCSRHNLSSVQVIITKFGSDVQNTVIKVPVVFGVIELDLQGQIQLKSQIYPILSLSARDKSPIEVKISKFGPKMHFSIVKIPIDFGLDWSSFSFLISKPVFFLPNFASHSFASFVHISGDHRKWVLHVPHGFAHLLIPMYMRTGSRHGPWNSLVVYIWSDHWISDSRWLSD